MNARKALGPPKGAAETTAAANAFRARFTPPEEDDPSPPPDEAKPRRSGRKDAAGMTRRTYYIATDIANDLDACVDRIHTACRQLIPKHLILAELIQHGIENETDVQRTLIQQLLTDLPNPAN